MRRNTIEEKQARLWERKGFWKVAAAYTLAAGVLTYCLNMPTWQAEVSYQANVQNQLPTLSLQEQPLLKRLTPWLTPDNTTSLKLQPLAIEHPALLQPVKTLLKKDGLGQFNTQQLQKAISTKLKAPAQEFNIRVETPDLNLTERLATHLNTMVQQNFGTYQQRLTSHLQKQIEQELLKKASQREASRKWAETVLQSEPLESFHMPVNLKDLGVETLQQQYRQLETFSGVNRQLLAQASTQESFYRSLLPEDVQKTLTHNLRQASVMLNKHTDHVAAATLNALLITPDISPETPEWQDTASELATATHELAVYSETLTSQLTADLVANRSGWKPVVEAVVESHIQSLQAQKWQRLLQTESRHILSKFDLLTPFIGAQHVWELKEALLDHSISQLGKSLEAAHSLENAPPWSTRSPLIKPVKQSHGLQWFMSWLAALALPFGLLWLWERRYIPKHLSMTPISYTKLLDILSHTDKAEVILVLSHSGQHQPQLPMALSGSLTRCGRQTLTLDIDLFQRQLSRLYPQSHAHGVLHHMLHEEMMNPYLLADRDVSLIPIEDTLPSVKADQCRQIVQRLPNVWQRWRKSHILLDSARWYPAFDCLLDTLDRVVIYQSQTPGAMSSTPVPPVALFKEKGIPVTFVTLPPETLLHLSDQARLNGLDRSLNPVVHR